MNPMFCKAIMVRFKLRKTFLKSKTDEPREAYKQQRKYCVVPVRKTKRHFYENFDVKLVRDNIKF